MDVGLVERVEEGSAALGGAHRPAGGAAVDEWGADVAFEALELGDQRGRADAEVRGGGVEAGIGHGLLEAA